MIAELPFFGKKFVVYTVTSVIIRERSRIPFFRSEF